MLHVWANHLLLIHRSDAHLLLRWVVPIHRSPVLSGTVSLERVGPMLMSWVG